MSAIVTDSLRVLVVVCVAHGLAAQSTGTKETKSRAATRAVKLEFRPAPKRTLQVHYAKDTSWHEANRNGKMTTEFVIRWTFEPRGRDHWIATGVFRSIQHRMHGELDGGRWTRDVAWTKERGYIRGRGTHADKKWVAPMIENGLRLLVDHRGACTHSFGEVWLGHRRGLPASAMLGFGAPLPGKAIEDDEEWTWRDRHFETANAYWAVATARRQRTSDGGKRVEIACSIQTERPDFAPRTKSFLVYSVADGLPRSSRFEQIGETRKVLVETRASWSAPARGGEKRPKRPKK